MKWMDKVARLVLVAGVGTAAAFGGLQLWERYGSSGEDAFLAYVPADTLIFAGGTEPFPSGEFFRSFKVTSQDLSGVHMDELQTEMEDSSVGVRFALAFFAEVQSLAAHDDYLARVGVPDSGRSALYTIGAAPVLRLELADPAAFEAVIKRAEERGGVTAEAVNFRGIDYRRYALYEGGEKDGPVYLSLSVRDGIATVLLEGEDLGGDEVRAMALGLEKPADSLLASGQLEELIKQRGFLPSAFGYISHREIVKGLAVPGGNRLSAIVDRGLAQTDNPELDWLRTLRSEACQKDALAIAELWPRTSVGYTSLKFGSAPSTEFDFVIESRDTATMELLRSLRGFIPVHAGSQGESALLGMALGLDVSAIPGVLGKSWQRMMSAQFNCPSLQAMQVMLGERNPAMVGAFLGMVSGIKGLSLVVRDIEIEYPEGESPKLKTAAGIATLSADDPRMLLSMAAGFLPELATLELPEDGTPVALPVPPEYGVTPMIAVSGKHLVVYVGDALLPTVKALKGQELTPNGFITTSVDYARYGRLLKPLFASGLIDQEADVGEEWHDEMDEESEDELVEDSVVELNEEPANTQAKQFELLMDEVANSKLKLFMNTDFAPDGVIMRTRLQRVEM